MYDVITVGSATIDVFVDTDSELIKIKTAKQEEQLIAYPAGTKLIIKNLNFTVGGGGTNTAVAFSRLGLKVGYLGEIGKDENGQQILTLLKKEKIDFLGSLGGEQTGYSVVLDSIEHDRTILTYKGANNELEWNEIKKSKLKTKWFYFASMVGKSFNTLELLADFAQKNKINIAFNPSSYQTKKGLSYLSKIIKKTTILILNKEEAQDLVGNDSVEYLLKRLSSHGPEIVIITDGKYGSYAYDHKTIYHLIPRKIKVVESTGAGDSFASSFVSSYIKSKDILLALRVAQTNSESVLQHYGAKNQLLTKKELDKKLYSYEILTRKI